MYCAGGGKSKSEARLLAQTSRICTHAGQGEMGVVGGLSGVDLERSAGQALVQAGCAVMRVRLGRFMFCGEPWLSDDYVNARKSAHDISLVSPVFLHMGPVAVAQVLSKDLCSLDDTSAVAI